MHESGIYVLLISFRPLIETFRYDEGMRRLFKTQSNPFIQRERFDEG